MKKRKLIKCHTKEKSQFQTPNPEQHKDNFIAPSAELLRTMLSLIFVTLSFFCALIGVVGAGNIVSTHWFSIQSCLGIGNLIVIVVQCILTLVYFHKKSFFVVIKQMQSFLLIISMLILLICFTLIGFTSSEHLAELYSAFGAANLSAILFPIFFSIYKEISNEKEKNYIVSYFSALTAFAALIVSLVALIKTK